MFIQNAPPDAKFSMVFSEQTEFKHRAHRVYEGFKRMYEIGLRMTPPDFRDMREFVPLQAADIVAYELNKEFERQLYRPKDKPRYPYSEILKMAQRVYGDSQLFMFHNKESVERFVSDTRKALAAKGFSPDILKDEWRKFFAAN